VEYSGPAHQPVISSARTAQSSYGGVGTDDIGAACGITGPSVYNHFATKLDMLTLAIDRALTYLAVDLADRPAPRPSGRYRRRGVA
jgi:AcrR family transcriptional regulator